MSTEDACGGLDTTLDLFTIQVNYKSGIAMIFKVHEFSIDTQGNSTNVSWIAAEIPNNPRPIKLTYDEIESVWQLNAVKGVPQK